MRLPYLATAILNHAAVRTGLASQGTHIPSDTVFLAGLHNTTSDEVLIFDTESLTGEPAAELDEVKGRLGAASAKSRRVRAASLGLGQVPEAELDESIHHRGRDWAQVRPEWGLAGNASFIAAPRDRTRGLDLGGRVFLHDYDAEADAEESVLNLIMVAPMVVASWMNLQYYGSVVDNRLFGSGNKMIHNVMGTFGVWQGNGGDLQSGLPLQSVHDGKQWVHEPLRLSVFLEAPRAAVDRVLEAHPEVRELVENGWIHLFAMDGAGGHTWRRLTDCGWDEAA